jgi:D-tyrosyl-tRNA(Tyr) deacylase
MRAVLQRVSSARVEVDGSVVGAIDHGLVALVGVGHEDDAAAADRLAEVIAHLRIFADDAGKMNLAVGDVGGAVLVVSQFTLFADTSRGRRPSFAAAAAPGRAKELVDRVAAAIARLGLPVETGTFRAHMVVSLVNDGPVTIVIDTAAD